MTGPTRFPELNAVLARMVEGAQEALAQIFCGAYLQGSFAVGDADEHSDVDFVVATHDVLTRLHVAKLRVLHRSLFALEVTWGQHLEGSYIPKAQLRQLDPARTPFLYLDNGASELVWDEHCNTAVVRWSLREHGVVLAGPHPDGLIDPVAPDDLRAEARDTVVEYAEWAPEPTKAGPMSRWKQPYLVLTFCRLLHTLESGTVVSKREAGRWAIDALDAEWADLIRAALADRPDPWGRVYRLADPRDIARTLAFAGYAVGVSAS